MNKFFGIHYRISDDGTFIKHIFCYKQHWALLILGKRVRLDCYWFQYKRKRDKLIKNNLARK